MRLTKFVILFLAACQGSPDPVLPPKKPLRDFRGIIHCHSLFSHDSKGTYEEILAAAKAAKIDFICMTDHPPKDDKGRSLREGWTGVHDGVLFIQGAEYSDQILGLGLKEPISGKDRRETIKAIHEQGGVAIACHPELIEDWDAYAEADGMEIYNVHATLQRKSKDRVWMLRIPKVMKENPEGSFQELQELDPAILKKWDEINQKRRFAGIAGNDAHQNVSFFGYQLDPYPRAFKFVTTHVYAEELTQGAILDAIKNGRCSVVFELSGRPECFSFGVGECCLGKDEALRKRITPGSEIVLEKGDERAPLGLSTDLPSIVERVRVGAPEDPNPFRDATRSMVAEDVVNYLCFDVPPGVYRVTLHRKSGDRTLPWVLSNPVFVRPRRP